MSDPGDPEPRVWNVATDLVEYLIVVVPDVGSLASVTVALADLVEAGMVRILDLAVIVRDDSGAVDVLDPASVEGMAALGDPRGEIGGLLSEHDIELAALALQPGTVGVVVVTEDRWAEPLSTAAQRAGGRIVAGDRIPPPRVEAVLADRSGDEPEGA